jgi:hypothetical protein
MFGAEKLEPVPERVPGVEPLASWERLILPGLDTRSNKSLPENVQIVDLERRMRLLGRVEVGFDSDMQLILPEFEPDPASAGKVRRLRNLSHPDNLAEEPAGRVFRARRGRDLDVMEANDASRHIERHRHRLILLAWPRRLHEGSARPMEDRNQRAGRRSDRGERGTLSECDRRGRVGTYSTRDSTASARRVIILLGFPTSSNVRGSGHFPGWVANQSTNS